MPALRQPCLFCHSESLNTMKVRVDGKDKYVVRCGLCQSIGPVRDSREEARKTYEAAAKSLLEQVPAVPKELTRAMAGAIWNAIVAVKEKSEYRFERVQRNIANDGDDYLDSAIYSQEMFAVAERALAEMAGHYDFIDQRERREDEEEEET